MSETTPTTDEVRDSWVEGDSRGYIGDPEAFDRWLVAHDRQVAAKAWDEGYDEAEHYERGNYGSEPPSNPYRTPEQPEGENR